MAGVMYLGNQMVSPVIVKSGGEFNVDVNDWIGDVNADGELVAPQKDMNFVFTGVKTINSNILESKFKNNTRVKSVSFPDLESITASMGSCFYGCSITSVDFPKLKTLSSRSALFFAFRDNPITNINMPELETANANGALTATFHNIAAESVSLPKLKTAVGDQVMAGTFSDSQNLKRAYLPALETIDSDGSYSGTFLGCELLEYVDLSSLSIIGDGGLSGFFEECSSLKTVAFPSLVEIKDSGMNGCFSDSGIETLTFPELVKINSNYSLYGAFRNCSLLQSLYFPKLTTIEITTEYTDDCFTGMLSGCENVVVHFNADFEDIIIDLPDVVAGFGGTNTTTLFDIDACTIVVNVSGSSNYKIYINGREKVSPFTTGTQDKNYSVYDLSNNRIYFGTFTGLEPNETKTFNVDVTGATNKITISTGIPGLTVFALYKGNRLPLIDEGNGNYSFYSNGTDEEFSYEINETATTRKATGTFTLTGAAQTISVTPEQKEWLTFDRPDLEEDGIMGGDAFAVASSGCYSTSDSYQAYNAVDGSTSTSYYWYSTNIANPIYYFYNPQELKIESLSFRWTSTSYRATQVVVAGSNDYENWTNIGTYTLTSATTATATINSNTPYKYYRLTFTKGGTYIRLVELTITGTAYR